MKKVFYSIAVVSAMMFASCSEDRGRTYETADANQDESVNRSHIRGNETAMGGAGTATDMTTGSDATWRSNSERIAGQMATDMQLDDQTRSRVQQTLYERERRLSELGGQYNMSETNRMGGQVAEDVDNTATVERDRIDRDGGTMTDTRGNMNTTTPENTTEITDMEAERRLIMTDTDRELESILSPEQYRQYQEKRANYLGMTSEGTDPMNNDGTMQNSGQDGLNNNRMNNNQNNNNQMNNSQNGNNLPGTNTNPGTNRNGN
jgi:hypothetical protein